MLVSSSHTVWRELLQFLRAWQKLVNFKFNFITFLKTVRLKFLFNCCLIDSIKLKVFHFLPCWLIYSWHSSPLYTKALCVFKLACLAHDRQNRRQKHPNNLKSIPMDLIKKLRLLSFNWSILLKLYYFLCKSWINS